MSVADGFVPVNEGLTREFELDVGFWFELVLPVLSLPLPLSGVPVGELVVRAVVGPDLPDLPDLLAGKVFLVNLHS